MALLDGRTALVTGGARGIGAAVAARFVEEGARAAVADIDLDAAAATAASLGGEDVATGVAVDVSDRASVEDAFDEVASRYGPPDVVVVNAGVLVFEPVLDMPVERWQRTLDVNLTGAFHTCAVAARHLVDAGTSGSIILSSSLFGLRGGANNGAYSASKFGMIGLMESLAAELAPHGIRVNAVCPGQVDTLMMRQLIAEDAQRRDVSPDVVEAELVDPIPMGRMGSTREVADAYVYLASELSGYVTGQSHVLDGGWQVGW